MIQKIIRVGNSLGIIIPNEVARKSNLKVGKKVFIDKDPNGSTVLISENANTFKSSVTPDFLKIVNSINKKYGTALRNLAISK